jgi:membrane protein implicated in regulation of membrane protease activity
VAWWIWVVIALVIGIVEVTTFTFVLLWIAIAGLITALLTPVVTNVWMQLLVFAIISTILFTVTRPLARRWKQNRTYERPNETIVGQIGYVVSEARLGTFATVRVQGDLWSAQASVGLQVGQQVIVESASSTVLTVAPTGEGE